MINRLIIVLMIIISLLIVSWLNPAPQPSQPVESRFVKLNQFGEPMRPWEGPWSCVLDNKTGLIWENKTDNESIHDGYWSYSWYDENVGTPNLGDCYFEANRCDVMDLVNRTNKSALCGRSDWRLPSENELITLVERSFPQGHLQINPVFFPNTKKGDYWTSNHSQPLSGGFKHLHEGASAINFLDGRIRKLPYRNAAFVRMVTEVSKKSHTKLASSPP